MKSINLIFPHQLFEESPLLDKEGEFYAVEEFLFFKQYHFHQQKIAFHRASMKFYEAYLVSKGKTVKYIDSDKAVADIRKLIPQLKKDGVGAIHYIDTTDNWLEKRLHQGASQNGIDLIPYRSPFIFKYEFGTYRLL